MSNPTYMKLHYIGTPAFIEQCEPIVSKNEFGLDVSTRKFRGASYLLSKFLSGLRQGGSATGSSVGGVIPAPSSGNAPSSLGVVGVSNSGQLYLQRWETTDENRGFSTVYLYYKGLLNGKIPNPQFFTDTATKSVTVTRPNQQNVQTTYDILYYARTNSYKYIANSLTAPLPKNLTVDAPTVINSVYTDSSGQRRSGFPNGLALEAIIERDQRSQVYGTPYYECEVVIAGVIGI